MKTHIAFVLLGALALPAAAAPPRPDADRFIAAQGWKKHAHFRPVAMPATDIVPIMYFGAGAAGPSCALLASGAPSPVFIPMLGPAPGQRYPQCARITDASAFAAGGKHYLVFELLNRDARAEKAVVYFYVSKDASGQYAPDVKLNAAAASAAVIAAAAQGRRVGVPDGARLARLALLHAAAPGMTYLHADSISDGVRTLAPFADQGHTRCDFVSEAGGRIVRIGHDVFAEGDQCVDVLATSQFERAGTTYFLAMFKGLRKKRMAVISVTRANVVTAEKHLAALATDNVKMTEMRSVKNYLRTKLK